MNIENNIWIGLAEVSSNEDSVLLNGAQRAYVNVLAVAHNSNDFIDKVKKAITDLKLDFIDIEEVELFSFRMENYKIDEKIINLANEVKITKGLRFGNFHTFN